MGYDIHAEKGWVHRGNLYRFKQLMRRAAQGDRMTMAFLGGSITQGSVSTQYTNCYAYLVFDWFVKRFPGRLLPISMPVWAAPLPSLGRQDWKKMCCYTSRTL